MIATPTGCFKEAMCLTLISWLQRKTWLKKANKWLEGNARPSNMKHGNPFAHGGSLDEGNNGVTIAELR